MEQDIPSAHAVVLASSRRLGRPGGSANRELEWAGIVIGEADAQQGADVMHSEERIEKNAARHGFAARGNSGRRKRRSSSVPHENIDSVTPRAKPGARLGLTKP